MTELRPGGLDSDGGRHFTAWSDDRLLGRVTTTVDHGWLRVAFDEAGVVNGVAERQALIDAVIALARSERLMGVVLAATTRLLVRYQARAVGFAGPLRGELVGALGDLGDGRPSPGPSPSPERGDLERRFMSDLQTLLPGVVLLASSRPPGRLRSLLRVASSGMTGTVHLTAQDEHEDLAFEEPLRLAVPLDDDVMAEGVALAIDTALSIRRRFHPLVDVVRIFYDHSIQGLRTGSIGGVAEAHLRDVHLNPAYALVSELDSLDNYIRDRASQPQLGEHGRRPPLTVLPPATRIDSVVAHEYWHQIEFGLESGRYRDSVELRRVIGGYFGVDTLEHAIKGNNPKAPASWQAAYVRLAREVSQYATTTTKEATAELFAQWWCTAGAPPLSARAFGEVLREFFPDADLTR
jgi:hypothetical protein